MFHRAQYLQPFKKGKLPVQADDRYCSKVFGSLYLNAYCLCFFKTQKSCAITVRFN